MEQLLTYGDERVLAYCAFCGGETGTRDHCPSRVFLDEPYPENLPVVPACQPCNNSFSSDEEYVACLLSCVLAGSSDPEAAHREKVSRILRRKPALRARIEQARTSSGGIVSFRPEHPRVAAVITKLAQGHALYELHEPCPRPPDQLIYRPLAALSDADRAEFESPEPASIWPEVGSRAMQRLIMGAEAGSCGWLEVQRERYRFHASAGGWIEVRIVIQEYLACLARWDD